MSAATSSEEKRTKLKKLDVLGDDFDAVPDSEASKLKSKRGTTIVCLMGNGFVVMGVDSHITSAKDGELLDPDNLKLFKICDGVVASHAGYVHAGDKTMKMVSEQCKVVPPLSLEEVVSWTVEKANWCNNMEKCEPSVFIVGGKIPKSSTSKSEAFLVNNEDGEKFRSFRSSSHFCEGSDDKYARNYVENHIHLITGARDDPIQIAGYVRDALAFAVKSSDGSTGGNLSIVIMREDGGHEMYTVAQKNDKSYGDLVRSNCQLREF